MRLLITGAKGLVGSHFIDEVTISLKVEKTQKRLKLKFNTWEEKFYL